MINHPLRLATGSHPAGSGKGCAMNVISWENGDTTITDLPECADPVLARIVQRVNDTICTHRDGDLLCPPCSVKVLELAHRTVGTGGPHDLERRRVWVRIAADQARTVLHLAKSREVAEAAIVAAEQWADSPTPVIADIAAYTTTASHAAYAYQSAAYAYQSAADAAYAAAYAYAASAANAACTAAAAAAADVLSMAHRAIDVFYQHTHLTEQPANPQRTADAVAAMTAG